MQLVNIYKKQNKTQNKLSCDCYSLTLQLSPSLKRKSTTYRHVNAQFLLMCLY